MSSRAERQASDLPRTGPQGSKLARFCAPADAPLVLDGGAELASFEIAYRTYGALNAAKVPHLRWVVRMGEEADAGMINFSQVKELGTEEDLTRLDVISGSLDPDEAINIQFTSGTTGNPKGATLSHKNILNNARFAGDRMRFTEADKLCIPVPMYHCFAMVLGALLCVVKGATMVFPAEAFDPRSTLEAISEEGCTACHGVPTMWVAMLAEPDFDSVGLNRLRTGKIGGAPVPREVMRRLSEEVGVTELLNAYGMTETSPVSFINHHDDDMDARTGTTGRSPSSSLDKAAGCQYRRIRRPAAVPGPVRVISSFSRTITSSVTGLTMFARLTRPRIESASWTSTFSPR